MPQYDPYLDQSLPPPTSGGNEPTTAPYAPPYQELGYPSPSPTPTYPTAFNNYLPNTLPANPFGDPYSNLQAGSTSDFNPDAGRMYPYDPNYDYGNPIPNLVSSGTDAGLPPAPDLSNIPPITYNAPGTGPSDTGNGPLYYDPVTKSWISRAASAVTGIPGAVARGAGAVARGIAGIPGSIKNAIEAPGYSSPDYLRSIGYTEGQGTGSLWPGAVTGPTTGSAGLGGGGIGGEGGSFYGGLYAPHGVGGPLPGSSSVMGQGSHGMIPWDYYARLSLKRLLSGGDPSLGYGMVARNAGDRISQFAAGGTGWGGTNMFGGYGIQGAGGRVAAPVLPISQWGGANPFAAEPSSTKPGGGAAAGGIGGGGPGGIP